MLKLGPIYYVDDYWADYKGHNSSSDIFICTNAQERLYPNLDKSKRYKLRIYDKKPRTDVISILLIKTSWSEFRWKECKPLVRAKTLGPIGELIDQKFGLSSKWKKFYVRITECK